MRTITHNGRLVFVSNEEYRALKVIKIKKRLSYHELDEYQFGIYDKLYKKGLVGYENNDYGDYIVSLD